MPQRERSNRPPPRCPTCKGPMADGRPQAVALITDALYDYCDQDMAEFQAALDEALAEHRARLDRAAIDSEHEEDE